ncbi:hypothetical protein C8R44DRAFT_550979, partial [Mycena epipterygia]
WLRDSITDLTKVDLGCHYASVLAALVQLEKAAGFEVEEADRQHLSTAKHPKQIAEWIRGGRGTKTKQTPKVKKAATFAREWAMWWDAVQPSWRTRGPDGK